LARWRWPAAGGWVRLPRRTVAARRVPDAANGRSLEIVEVVLMELVVDFAVSGRLGPVACGQTLAEVQQLLGPYEWRMEDRRPRRWRPRLHGWGDLELVICHDVVVTIGLQTWRDHIDLPEVLGLPRSPGLAMLGYDDVLAGLRRAGCAWHRADDVVSGDGTVGIRTVVADVQLAFWSTGNGLRLKAAFKSDPGPHPDHGRRDDARTEAL
jgi:hypothetical protein